jgi:hypothetical protein
MRPKDQMLNGLMPVLCSKVLYESVSNSTADSCLVANISMCLSCPGDSVKCLPGVQKQMIIWWPKLDVYLVINIRFLLALECTEPVVLHDFKSAHFQKHGFRASAFSTRGYRLVLKARGILRAI